MRVTLDTARIETTKRLRAAGIDTPALDARVLLGSATGLTIERLIANGHELLAKEHKARLFDYVNRRLSGEPVSRIKGEREFYGRKFQIDPHTLDPRPDTETLIGAALDEVVRMDVRALRVLDLGTGSGCLLITLLAERPHATGIGTDISLGALMCAKENARRFGVEHRARFAAANWFEGLSGSFDLIVSNPPYIPSKRIASLAPEVALHDPRRALDGGPDGLCAYRAIARDAGSFLAPGGRVLVEIGEHQGDSVARLFQAAGLAVEGGGVVADLAGRPRVIRAKHADRGTDGTSQSPKIKLGQRGCSG